MRILFVIRDMVSGGAGKQLAMTANALSRKGHEVFIYSYVGGENSHYIDSSVKYIAQKPVPKTKTSEYFYSIFNIRKQLKNVKPDVAISWRCNAGCFTVIAALGTKIKTIFSQRTDPYMETSAALKLSAFVAGFSDGGVFQLESVRKYFKRLYRKSIVIHNPIDVGKVCYNPIPYDERPNKIAYVGRMVLSQKRQDVMLAAFGIFLESCPDFVLHFYGDGRDIEQIKIMAKELNVSKSVIFHGAVENVPDLIRDAKILVLTSDYEGIPNVVLEAFSVGVPVVSTDSSPGGARLLIEDGKNGFLAPVGDAKTIAKKMSEVVKNDKIAERFINQGRVRIADFEPDKIFDGWNDYLLSFKRK